MMDYKNLYFADDELDISKVLTSVGVTVKIGNVTIKWAHDFGDLGGEPEGLDCTPLSAKVKMQKAGLVEQDNWTVDYYYNNDDYQALETLKKADSVSDISVTFSDGTKFTNKGKVSANYLSGQGVNGIADAHAVVELSNPDGWNMTPGE